MKSLVLLSFLKQLARQLKKEKSLKSNQALNEAARELGYYNLIVDSGGEILSFGI